MRLLNTRTLRLEEFFSSIPPYAILSHCWGFEEVTFEEVHGLPGSEKAIKHKAGWQKVLACCQRTLQEGFQYVWVDTCCINKSSSAELSEAINSMFRLYRDAAVCFAYLADVPNLANKASFLRSRWFTRGWTLQELIAPREVIFLDASWHSATTRRLVADEIHQATGIDAAVFLSSRSLRSFTVAQRFSWAARRNTSRLEDQAYSLLGLFGVHMPLLYGEGTNAFLRLQEEVLRVEQDLSIFAWSVPEYVDSVEIEGGVLPLAPSLSFFTDCGGVVSAMSSERRLFESPDIVATAHSVQLTTRVIKIPSGVLGLPDRIAAVLDCRHVEDVTKLIAMELNPVSRSLGTISMQSSDILKVRTNNRSFFLRERIVPVDVFDVTEVGVTRTILIQRTRPWSEMQSHGKEATHSHIWLRFENPLLGKCWNTRLVFPEQHWRRENLIFDLNSALEEEKWRIFKGLGTEFTAHHVQASISVDAAIVMSDGSQNQIVIHVRTRCTSPFHSSIEIRLDHYHPDSNPSLNHDFENIAGDFPSSIRLQDGTLFTVQRCADLLTDKCIAHFAISLDK